ncbi:STN and carboxypeptidase regulatory-like domain-containing protein [Cytophagales bacterium LB-30]|uniref:STN and carboxypeptidase regulatory-like domain-containing protein n=1 Tax=Shiella aurantiaca TaxID=3058365 RepID=A0ABT8F1B4_9BACT|nr:STN and carboxypeptidase regulatory-like domain-containing protein [Shiella aurantiaca]MDN4164195.1 STN and carboxypeptidase regulatory-like domain-containing protein [Shiella aurantiaca]
MKSYWTERAVRNKHRLLSIFFSFCLMGLGYPVSAQSISTPPLERELSISFENISLENALNRLAKEGQFSFAYNAELLNIRQKVNYRGNQQSVRQILIALLGTEIQLKEKGNHIILTKAPEKPAQSATNSPEEPYLLVSGYVLNGQTGKKIAQASIYHKQKNIVAQSNEYGFFTVKIPKPDSATVLVISKKDFADTTAIAYVGPTPFLSVYLNPIPVVEASEAPSDSVLLASAEPEYYPVFADRLRNNPTTEDSTSNFIAEQWIQNEEAKTHVENIEETLESDIAFSVFPFAGTNGLLSGNTRNNVSVNLLGGYSKGTNIMELAGLFNIDNGDVSGIQMAGLFNINSGKMTGLQAAGLINVNGNSVIALQSAGLMNINARDAHAWQMAGLLNINGGKGSGAQMAGLGNIQAGDYKGSQFAGLFNISEGRMQGAQFAGFLNRAHYLKGTQMGFINVADSVKGVSFGFLSFVKHGYHQIEVSADEIFYTNLAFRTGVNAFYNIFSIGAKPQTLETIPVWTVGYGIGTAPRLTRWLYLNFDITANHLSQGDFLTAVSLLNKGYLGLELRMGKKLGLAAGFTYNVYLQDYSREVLPLEFVKEYQPRIIDSHSYNPLQVTRWWGAKVAVRFL